MSTTPEETTNLIDANAAAQSATQAEAQSAAAKAGAVVQDANGKIAFSYDEKASETVFGKIGADGRPENVSPKYWDPAAKRVKGDVVLNQLRWAEGKLGKKLDVIGGPADGTEYTINLPKEIKRGDENVPVDFEIDPQDAAVQGFLAVARKHDVSQAFVDEVMAEVVANAMTQRGANLTDEIKKIGKDSEARLTDMQQFLTTHLPPAEAKSITDMITSANAFTALEALVRSTGAPRFAPKETETHVQGKMTVDQWNALNFEEVSINGRMERRRAVDPVFNAMVEAKRDEVFGTTRRDASGRPVSESGAPLAQ